MRVRFIPYHTLLKYSCKINKNLSICNTGLATVALLHYNDDFLLLLSTCPTLFVCTSETTCSNYIYLCHSVSRHISNMCCNKLHVYNWVIHWKRQNHITVFSMELPTIVCTNNLVKPSSCESFVSVILFIPLSDTTVKCLLSRDHCCMWLCALPVVLTILSTERNVSGGQLPSEPSPPGRLSLAWIPCPPFFSKEKKLE